MPPRSKVQTLPDEVRDALNAKLISSGFSGYVELAGWLTEQGYEISRGSLQRYGSDLQESFEQAMGDVRRSIEMAKAMGDSVKDDEGDLTNATVRVAQDCLLRVTLALREAEHAPDKAASVLAKVSHAMADLGRLGISLKKWQAEVQVKAEAAASQVEKIAKKGGLDASTVAEIRREILGVAG